MCETVLTVSGTPATSKKRKKTTAKERDKYPAGALEVEDESSEDATVEPLSEEDLTDGEFEALVFAEIYESFDRLPDSLRLRHTIFCVRCIRANLSLVFEARDLDACLRVASDIEAPHGDLERKSDVVLHWPPKRPSPSKPRTSAPDSNSSGTPLDQEPFATIMDRGNQSISLINRLLPQTESHSLMLDIYCQRQNIRGPQGERLVGTSPYDFDAALPIHHAYAAETISLSQATHILVCGSFAKKFFEQNFNTTSSNPTTVSIAGRDRTVYWIPHPEYLIRFSTAPQRNMAEQTLRRFAQASGQTVDLTWFQERIGRVTGAEPERNLPSKKKVKQNRTELSQEVRMYTDDNHRKGAFFERLRGFVGGWAPPNTEKGQRQRAKMGQWSRSFLSTYFDISTPEGRRAREARRIAAVRMHDPNTDRGRALRKVRSIRLLSYYDTSTADGLKHREEKSKAQLKLLDIGTAKGRATREAISQTMTQKFDISTPEGLERRGATSKRSTKIWDVNTEKGHANRAALSLRNKKSYDVSTQAGRSKTDSSMLKKLEEQVAALDWNAE